ncbi:2-dehydro-3-deoxy-phosphogluconate aldolase [Amphibacillus sp. Q70]|uniref:2-dehydro-3-deoxy-phosphogluconate aldolase n=1 Tax=Amphibacillus sp. Q70 TaxID=3453416 RepID=UPI003F856B15
MQKKPTFYKDRVCLNVLTNSVANAIDCYQIAEGNVVLGVLSINYDDDQSAIVDMIKYQEAVDNAISVGLGAGDPNQSDRVARISKEIQPQHVNQVFTGIGKNRTLLNQNETLINGLVSPTGKVGYVNIATGPLSSQSIPTEVPIETAIALLKDMGGNSVKYFPMKGLKHKEEYKAVAEACAKSNFILEPTGGIDFNNFREIIEIAINAGVRQIIPHIYSSIIDPRTGETKPEHVHQLYEIVKSVLG